MLTNIREWSTWKLILIVILAMGAYAAVIRYAQGLGAATNLSDSFPWGLWIGFDVLVGVGLAAGGFVIAATVHIFRIERFESIARPTILTAFLGYQMVILALLFDLGRPYRIWHPLVMWNTHSVMFEIGWCVTLYTIVLALEFSPIVFERFGLEGPLRTVRMIYVPLVIIGVLLSTLHQSSLGTLYVIAPDKLHSLWYSPLLPVFFFISAVAGGLAMTIFESFMTQRAFGKKLEASLLRELARITVVVLAVYAVWRFQDVLGRAGLLTMFSATPESVMFWGEMGLGVLLPMVLFATPRIRRSESGMFLAAVLTILGFVVNRLNVAVTGMAASSGVSYVPSWMEFALTVSVVAVGFTLFGLAVKHLPVFPREEFVCETDSLPHAQPLLTRPALAALWGLLAVGVVAVITTSNTGGADSLPILQTEPEPTVNTTSLILPDSYPFPVSKDSLGLVIFNHDSHVDPDRPDCAGCHAEGFRFKEAGQAVSGFMTYERIHEGDLCASCHDGTTSFEVDECDGCHSS